MKSILKQLAIVCILCLPLAGCFTTAPRATVNLNKLQSQPVKINDVFVIVNTSSFPEEFPDAFATNLETLLQEQGINAEVRQTSPLDLEQIQEKDYSNYTNIMTIRVSHRYLDEYGLKRFTMQIYLGNKDADIVLMDGTIVVNRSFNEVGFKQPGGENAARELISHMQTAALL